MQRTLALIVTLLLASAAEAQAPAQVAPAMPAAPVVQAAPLVPAAPMTAAPPAESWGGYALPSQVPYQPTLQGPPAEQLPGDPNQPWQAYPTTAAPAAAPTGPPGAVYLDGPPAQELPPGVPLYPGTNEPSLRASLTPPGARNGFFQQANFWADEIPQFGYNNLGWTDLHADVVTALPFFTRENPIIITPSYELHFLDSPIGFDLPPRLNDAAIDFHVFRVFENHWIADFAVQPGLYADDHSFGDSEALRFTGRAVGVYAPTIDLKYALGVTYLDGGWSKIVPVAGVIYKPTDDVEYELVFPTPKISWRLPWTNIPGRDERWIYVRMDYGNSAWAFKDANGTDDVLDYRDYRLILGVERRIVGGLSHHLEIGYVFNRDMKIASVGGNEITMASSLVARVGVSY